jgi:inhibitor of KinA sporulation pathway (predicted exonuclease)
MTTSSYPQIPHAVIYDFEFTAWDGSMARRWLAPGEYKEIVQIGAVKVAADFSPLETFDCLVRPRLNPVLSDYLETLTGITNDAVAARGVDFAEAYERFVSFAGALPVIAFGRDDLVLSENIRLYGLARPPMAKMVDIRPWLIDNDVDVCGLHACDVGPAAGVPFEGQIHNALADALSVASGIKALMARGAAPPAVTVPKMYP